MLIPNYIHFNQPSLSISALMNSGHVGTKMAYQCVPLYEELLRGGQGIGFMSCVGI